MSDMGPRVRVKILQPAHNNEAIFSERTEIHELARWIRSMANGSDYWSAVKVEIAPYKEPPKKRTCECCGQEYTS